MYARRGGGGVEQSMPRGCGGALPAEAPSHTLHVIWFPSLRFKALIIIIIIIIGFTVADELINSQA